MDFDLRTCDTAYYFVLEFMNMTPDEYLTELSVLIIDICFSLVFMERRTDCICDVVCSVSS